jgi:hypothetical protein
LVDYNSSSQGAAIAARYADTAQRYEVCQYFSVQRWHCEAWGLECVESSQERLAVHSDRNSLLRVSRSVEGLTLRSEV